MIRPRRNGRRNALGGLAVSDAGVDNPQLVVAAADAVELLLLDVSLEPDFSAEPDFSPEPDLSLEAELDPESLEEDPLLELLDFLPDSRLSVR
jgi:hypothetical protein